MTASSRGGGFVHDVKQPQMSTLSTDIYGFYKNSLDPIFRAIIVVEY